MKKQTHRSTSAPVVACGSIFAKEQAQFSAYLSKTPASPPRRPVRTGRVAHIVAQIVDGGHAPSRLLRTLLHHHSLPVYLLSTEAHVYRMREPQPYLSDRSRVRGQQTLAGLPRLWLEEEFSTHEATARRVAEQLTAWEIDVAIFHGCHPLHLFTAQICDVPHKVFFDHGGLPPEGIFDQIISSRPAPDRRERVDVIPFVVEPPYVNPNPGPFFTTVSNHLDTRVTPAMQRAIHEILERCPSAHYIAIGQTRLEPFHPRVHFPGASGEPAEHMRHMRAYLNEFPHGSGLALLDAMGAGVPIVALQGDGAPQAHYGADYFGRPAASVEAYVETATRLLEDDALHAEWSAHARAQFAKRGSPTDYVAAIEHAVPMRGSASLPDQS